MRIWPALHTTPSIEIDAVEAGHVQRFVFGMDDEPVARPLAAKLGMVRRPGETRSDDDVARCGSDVLYSVQ